MDSRLLLNTVIDSMKEGVVIQDHTGAIVSVNPAAEKILCLSIDQMRGRKSTDPRWRSIHENGAPFPGEEHPAMIALKTGKSQRGTLMGIVLPDETKKWIRINAAPIFENNSPTPTHVVATFEDITVERTQLKQLEESQERLQLSLILGEAGTWEIDLEKRQFHHSGALVEFFGEGINQTDRTDLWEYVHPDDLSKLKELWEQHKLGGPPLDAAHRIIHSSGRVRWVKAYTKIAKWKYSKPIRVIGFLSDISNRVEQEEKLQEALSEAERASQIKSTFVANMSHEIRTPLNGIIGMAHILETTELEERQKEYLETIVNSGETLRDLLDDVLDISKIESNRMELHPAENNLYKTISAACTLYSNIAIEKGLSFSSDLDRELNSRCLFDATRIRQCLFNLLSNAVKFTLKGEITVSASVLKTTDSKRLVQCIISDTGCGIPTQGRTDLFEEFVQLESNTTRSHSGTGLGLAITRRLARLMGGDVTLNSQYGKGSEFTLTFEIEQIRNKQVVETHQNKPSTKSRELLEDVRILVVDDHEVNRKILNVLLTTQKAISVEVSNGFKALKMLEKEKFDLIILDIHMPVMDGRETLLHIRKSDKPWKDIPVVILTADVLDKDNTKWSYLGLNGYVTKPINTRDLYAQIKSALN